MDFYTDESKSGQVQLWKYIATGLFEQRNSPAGCPVPEIEAREVAHRT